MDYRCPVCRANLKKRRLTHAIVAQMEIDCSYCKSTIRFNVHRAETIIVLLSFVAIVVLGSGAYWLQDQSLALLAFGAAMAGSLALPLIEQTYLRNWPRFTSDVQSPPP